MEALRVLYDAVRVEMNKRLATFPPEQDTTELVALGVLVKFRRTMRSLASGYHTELWIGEYQDGHAVVLPYDVPAADPYTAG